MSGSAIRESRNGSEPVIVGHDLVKRYGRNQEPALRGVTIRVTAGECYGLLGVNGAGKTTALSILSGLVSPDAGSIRIFGHDPCKQRRAIRQSIAIVPQELALYDVLTIAENLRFFGCLSGLDGARLLARVEACLSFVDLQGFAKSRVAACSGGIKRRLNLAIGLLAAPRILFLDEPTVGIDIQSRHLIYAGLQEIRRQGTTVVYTTHYLKEAQELCDRIGILDDGRLIDEGTPHQLLQMYQADSLDRLLLQRTAGRIAPRASG